MSTQADRSFPWKPASTACRTAAEVGLKRADRIATSRAVCRGVVGHPAFIHEPPFEGCCANREPCALDALPPMQGGDYRRRSRSASRHRIDQRARWIAGRPMKPLVFVGCWLLVHKFGLGTLTDLAANRFRHTLSDPRCLDQALRGTSTTLSCVRRENSSWVFRPSRASKRAGRVATRWCRQDLA